MRFRDAVQDPVILRRFHGWATIIWIGMIPVSIITGWIDAVSYVAALSLWALVTGHWSAYQAAKVEVRQEELSPEGNLDASDPQ